ncbi:hypothetical protein [Roseovarius sp. D22-M7]|uniref:hypothetical protein n=1 Tax=Roseovarius sp. D22-M7 TaxID=3127116 RepID=UPI0030102EC4
MRNRYVTMRLRMWGIGYLLSTVLLAAPFSAAEATSSITGLERVFSPQPSGDSQSPKSALAQCPSDKQVIGGGGWVHAVTRPQENLGLPESSSELAEAPNVAQAEGAGGERLVLTQLEPYQDGYQVTAAELAPGTDVDWWVQAYAICADAGSLSGQQVVSSATPLSSQSAQQAIAVCPEGKRTIGSGARINAPEDKVVLQVARSSGPGDIVRAQGSAAPDGINRDWNVVAFAICVDPPPGYEIVYGESDERESEASKLAVAECPGNKRLHGAGAAITTDAPGNASLQLIYPFDDLRRVQAFAVENTPTDQNWDFIVAQAICAD